MYAASLRSTGALVAHTAEVRHPITGAEQQSPALPGAGWPGDPATVRTPAATSPDEVTDLARSAPGLDELDARVSVCRACPRLVAWREQVAQAKRAAYRDQPYWGRPVPGLGDPQPQVLLVGLAPGAHGGNRTGRMFTGDRSGEWLYAALHRAGYASAPTSDHAGDGLVLTGLRITAAGHCVPPENKPTPAELAACSGWFDRELDLVTPTLEAVLALGQVGWRAALAAARRLGWQVPRPLPRFGHQARAALGSPARTVRLVGSYHVSQQNTSTGRLTTAMLDAAIAQLGRTGDEGASGDRARP